MSTTLYPLKFEPILKERLWGGNKLQTELNKSLGGRSNIGESWELSGVEGSVSVVSNGFLKGNALNELIEIYMGDLVGERVFQQFGHEFPLLIKFLDAREALSIQVHPDDELAQKRHQSLGKTEMWYVMQAEKEAQLISGFKGSVTKDKYINSVEENTVEALLAYHTVKPGDVFYIPAGRVHAIGAGILLAEIQQTSDVTYRIYDFGRRDSNGHERELHTLQALDAIDFSYCSDYRTSYKSTINEPCELITAPNFKTVLLEFNEQIARDYYSLDSFVILICTEGSAQIHYGENRCEEILKGETLLVPADLRQVSIKPQGLVKLLEVFMPL
jgi:mannose-6-phosphate isomerase